MGDVKVCQKSPHDNCRMGRRIVSARSVIVNATVMQCTGSVQRRLTADWLAPQESDRTRTCSKVSSDWLPSYIKTTQTVLEIFKKSRYFPGRPRTYGMILTVHAHIASLSSINESWGGTKK